MSALTFDTHFFVKKLMKDGEPEKQAESIVEFVRGTREAEREADLALLATKGDITELRSDMRALEFRLEATLIKWMIGLLFLQAGLIITVIKLMH